MHNSGQKYKYLLPANRSVNTQRKHGALGMHTPSKTELDKNLI